MNDRTTKALLAAIALGLWVDVATRLFATRPVLAQDFGNIERYLRNIENNVSAIESKVRSIESHVDDIEDGTCSNGKICR